MIEEPFRDEDSNLKFVWNLGECLHQGKNGIVSVHCCRNLSEQGNGTGLYHLPDFVFIVALQRPASVAVLISSKSDEGPEAALLFDSDAIVGVVSVLRTDVIGDSPTEVMNRMAIVSICGSNRWRNQQPQVRYK